MNKKKSVKQKRICVVGAGRWGSNHIRTLSELSALGGVVESNRDRLEVVKDTYPDIRRHSAIDEAARHDYDGFVVATPAQTHFELARYLLEHRRPVLVEKPITLNVADAVTLQETARRNKVQLMVGHVLLFHPAIRKIKELMDTGKLGPLQYIYSNRLNLGTVRTEENVFWSFAPHDISIFQYFIGQLPRSVVSTGGAFLQDTVHDTTMTTLTYPGNIVGHIFVSWLHPFKEHRLVVIGRRGMIRFEDSGEGKPLLFYEKGVDWIKGAPVPRNGPSERIPYPQLAPLTEELRYFIDHLDGPPIELADGQNGVDVLTILEKATQSLLEHNVITLGESTMRSTTIHPTSTIDDDVEIGEGTKVWHYCHIQSGARIGRECSFGQNVNVGPNVRIGDHVKIQNNVSVYEGVQLDNHVFVGPSAVFTNVLRPRSAHPAQGNYVPTRVEAHATIGANATIISGVTIGHHAFIGAGAVVTKDVPDHALVLGNPGRVAGWVDEKGERLTLTEDGASTDGRFRLENGRLVTLTDD